MSPRNLLAVLLSLIATIPLAETRSIAQPSSPAEFDRLLDSCPVVDEIDTAAQAPMHEFPEKASQVAVLLGRPARTLPAADTPSVMAWVIGQGKGLKPGMPYVLEVEYPDDVPRTIFVANRGADLVRGFSTGTAVGDARRQYVQPSIESLAYPQTGVWQRSRTVFFLHDRFQGLHAQRDPRPGGRPHVPSDGFHVIIFQARQLNDPRSQGAAVGRLRLRAVPDLAALEPKVEWPPLDLPRRHVFLREEMADEVVQARDVNDRGVADPLQWLLFKAKLHRLLAINTFAKDLLEFGFNQGWQSGDLNWVNNAQPPLTDLWDRAAPRIADEGLDLLPYYEYKGAIGLKEASPPSLGWQRRAEKLYHNLPNTRYTPVWWTEDHNADLTDPDTLADARRLLDRTIIAHKGKARFAGAWFRVRDNHLPMSFSEAAIGRFRAAFPDDALARTASRSALIASYEGDRTLYDRYGAWWLVRRAAFFDALAEHLARGLDDTQARLLFTPWTTEQIPMLRDPASGPNGHPIQVVTDDPAWWDAFARNQPDSSWFRWALVPTPFDRVVSDNAFGQSLAFHERVSPPPERAEHDHSAPPADPVNYRASDRVMQTYPTGRLFTVARGDLMETYRSRAGLAAVRHYTLNEDNHDPAKGASDLPFDGQLGYVCVDADRAGPHVRLMEARAVAQVDPTHLGSLCGSSFSTGFPGFVRQFNAAFLSVPALPSRVVPGTASDPEVIVREIPTPRHGCYYFVINTSMNSKTGVLINLPAPGAARDLLDHRDLPTTTMRLDMLPAELRSYRIKAN